MTMTAHAQRGLTGPATERLIRLFNAGYGVARLAAIFEVSEDAVQEVLDANAERRGRTVAEARSYPIPREDLPSVGPEAFGPGGPTFANHDGHVALVMAGGGFVAFSEYEEATGPRVGMPLIRPVFEGAAA
jgi:hypothetical protein